MWRSYSFALNYLPDARKQGVNHINGDFFSCKIASIFQHLSAANVNKPKIWATLQKMEKRPNQEDIFKNIILPLQINK